MAEPQAQPQPPPPSPGDGSGGGRPAPLIGDVQALLRLLPRLISDRVELLSLEMHRAGLALVQIAVLVVAIAILGVTAWLVLWGGVVAGLTAFGLHMAVALLIALLVNLGAVALAVVQVKRQLLLLNLPATRRHLMLNPTSGALLPDRAATPGHDERSEHQAAAV